MVAKNVTRVNNPRDEALGDLKIKKNKTNE